jgi:hypothetical protein
MFQPRAIDLDPVDIETALVLGAVGDYAEGAAVLLVITSVHWLRPGWTGRLSLCCWPRSLTPPAATTIEILRTPRGSPALRPPGTAMVVWPLLA